MPQLLFLEYIICLGLLILSNYYGESLFHFHSSLENLSSDVEDVEDQEIPKDATETQLKSCLLDAFQMSLGSLWLDVSLFQAGIGDEIFFGGSSLDGMLKVFFGRFSTEILEFYLNLKVRFFEFTPRSLGK